MNSVARRLFALSIAVLLLALTAGCLGRWTAPLMEGVKDFSEEEQSKLPEFKADVHRYRASENEKMFRPDPRY